MNINKNLLSALLEVGMKATDATSYKEVEEWLLKTHKIVLRPEMIGSKLIKFECDPWLIQKYENKVVSHKLCKYTGLHKFVIDAYEAGILGAIEYLQRESLNLIIK